MKTPKVYVEQFPSHLPCEKPVYIVVKLVNTIEFQIGQLLTKRDVSLLISDRQTEVIILPSAK